MGAAPVFIAILLALPVLLLAVPVDVAFRFEGVEPPSGQITIRWLFGLVRFRVRIPAAGKAPPEPNTQPQTPQLQVQPERHSRRPSVLAMLRDAAFRRRVYRFATDLVAALHLRQLRLRMRLGLGDPADTGRLWAFVGPLNVWARNLRDVQLQIEPEFIDPVFEFQAHGRLRLIPLQLLILAIGFALSPVSIRAWRTLRGSDA
jgi:Protein of unknown function (DUF2953)